MQLPEPRRSGGLSLQEALERRRSVRDYSSRPLAVEEISQLAWAAQGITEPSRGFRTAPSAGATFPLEVDLLITGSDGLSDGLYRYDSATHSLVPRLPGDQRQALLRASLGQQAIGRAPVVMVISGVLGRIEPRYGPLAPRFMAMEAGHVGQNVALQSVALGLGTVMIGAFEEARVGEVLQLPAGERPLYIIPIGWP